MSESTVPTTDIVLEPGQKIKVWYDDNDSCDEFAMDESSTAADIIEAAQFAILEHHADHYSVDRVAIEDPDGNELRQLGCTWSVKIEPL